MVGLIRLFRRHGSVSVFFFRHDSCFGVILGKVIAPILIGPAMKRVIKRES
jgi:hypothetical protein